MALYIRRFDTQELIQVRKYIINSDGEENIWSNEWRGRHVIGRHCELVKNEIIKNKKSSPYDLNKAPGFNH